MLHQATASRRDILRSGALFGAGGLLGSLPFSSAALAQEAGADWPQVMAMIERYVSERKVANMVVTLGWGQNAPDVLARGDTSFTSGMPVGPDSLYRIYSMTKPITGMGVMLCLEDGLISLDQPLAEILPAFGEMMVQKQADGAITEDNLEPAVRPITIRHLLTHTAGLGYGIVQQGPIADAYTDNGIVPGKLSKLDVPAAFRGTPAPSLEIFADNLAALPLVYQPGTRWSYSVAIDLLGRVIEVVSGQAFDAFLKQRIFDPCGMDSTWFRVPASESHRLTANYLVIDGNLLPVDMAGNSVYEEEPEFPFGGAGLVSTPRDYDRFLQMLAGWGMIEGTRVMSEPAVRLATSNLLPVDTLAPDGGFSFGESEFGYGAAGLVGRGIADGLFGWFGAAGTGGLVNLKYGLRHNMMTQYMPAETYPLYTEFPLAVATDAAAQMMRRS